MSKHLKIDKKIESCYVCEYNDQEYDKCRYKQYNNLGTECLSLNYGWRERKTYIHQDCPLDDYKEVYLEPVECKDKLQPLDLDIPYMK